MKGSRRGSVETVLPFSSDGEDAVRPKLDGQRELQLRRKSSIVHQDPTSTSVDISTTAGTKKMSKGMRSDYTVGDILRSPNHMIPTTTPEAVTSLQVDDYAFIQRSDGSYSYAILGSRTQDSLTFVMCTQGSTKTLSRKRWGELIRLVAPAVQEEKVDDGELVFEKCNRPTKKVSTMSLPRYISFDTGYQQYDDYSVISRVSLEKLRV